MKMRVVHPLLPVVLLGLTGCNDLLSKLGKGGADAGAAAPVTAADAAAAPVAAVTVDAGAVAAADAGAAKVAPVYVAFAGQTSGKTSFRVGIERVGTDVRAVFDTGTPIDMAGKMSDDTHFSLRATKVAKGEKPSTLVGELAGASLKATFTEGGGKPQSVTSGAAGPLASSFDAEYEGSLGKQFVRMKLSRRAGTLTGIYRYASSANDLHLEGLVHEDGRFELTEKSAGKVTGKMIGVMASQGAILAQWQSPDGTRTAPVTLDKGSGYPESATYDNGISLFPQEKVIEGKRCKTDVVFPQIRGVADKAAGKEVNDYLRGENAKAKTCEGPDDPTIPDFESSEGYQLDTKKGRFIGVRRSGYAYAGGAHGGGGQQCDVVDTKTVKHFKLATKMSDAGLAKLGDMVTQALAKQHNVTKLTDAGFSEDKVKVTKDTDMCLGDGWVDVAFDAYELGPYMLGPQEARFTFAQVKDLFAKDDVTDAIFDPNAAPKAAPSGSAAAQTVPSAKPLPGKH